MEVGHYENRNLHWYRRPLSPGECGTLVQNAQYASVLDAQRSGVSVYRHARYYPSAFAC